MREFTKLLFRNCLGNAVQKNSKIPEKTLLTQFNFCPNAGLKCAALQKILITTDAFLPNFRKYSKNLF